MNNYDPRALSVLRITMFLMPLLLGAPFLSFCLCSFNGAMTTVGGGPVRGGATVLITAALSALLCSMVGFGLSYGILFAVQTVLVSLVCAICFLTRRPFIQGLLLSSLAYGVPEVVFLRAEAEAEGLSLADGIIAASVAPMKEGLVGTLTSGGVPAETAERVFAAMEKAVSTSIPAALIIAALTAGYAVMCLVSRALRPTQLNNGHSFSNIRLGPAAPLYAAVMAALLFVKNSNVRLVAVNGLLIFCFLSFVNGMSVVDFFLKIKIKKPVTRIIIHFAVFFLGVFTGLLLPFIAAFYILIGIVDCFISIRKRVDFSR